MNPPLTSFTLLARSKELAVRCVRAFYRIFIEPHSVGEDARRREMIFNVIASSLFTLLCLLDLSVLYADLINLDKGGFGFFTFSLFVIFFGALLLLSRKGHTELAVYLFIGFYFLATTWGEYTWGTDVPLALLSYGAIIIMTNILLGTRAGFTIAVVISATLVSLGFMETHGIIASDLSWRSKPLEFKDTFEDSFVYAMIVTVSWLWNKELERSLARARRSEKALTDERDSLEVKVEERTRALKAAELEKVSQLYKFVEFGRLASGVFHDLLTPLTVVSLSVEKLGDGDANASGGTREIIDKAIQASKRVEAFIQTARKQLDSTEHREIFSIEKEVRDAADILAHRALKARVDIGIGDIGPITIYGNPVKFFQIVVNLISNAIDSYEGNMVLPTATRLVTISAAPTADATRISIADNGCGIPAAIQKSIFEPFFTTKRDRPRGESGFGLGLSTTKDIVEKNFDGTIELESAEGKGSTFTIVIPTRHDSGTAQRQDRSDTAQRP